MGFRGRADFSGNADGIYAGKRTEEAGRRIAPEAILRELEAFSRESAEYRSKNIFRAD